MALLACRTQSIFIYIHFHFVYSFSCSPSARTKGLVSKSPREVPKAGEAAAEGARPVGDLAVQRNDEEHPRLQRVERLSTVSASKFDKSISAGEYLANANGKHSTK